MRKEYKIFLTALMFYTRIPCPKILDHDPKNLNKATRYFPLIGWIVGAMSYAMFFVADLFLGQSIAIVLSLLVGVWLTGAFHEDGLADAADGFGGGWTQTTILHIMKDSRVGAFGAIAIVLLFLLKFTALETMLERVTISYYVPILFVCYHTLARFTAVHLIFTSRYSREDATSKVKPIAQRFGSTEVLGAYFFGLVPLCVLVYFQWKFIFVLLPLSLLVLWAKRYFEKWIDGYTGDCLGAVEQLAECVCILSFVVLCKFM